MGVNKNVPPIRIMHVIDTLGRGGLQNGLANLIQRMDRARFEHVICTTRHVEDPNAHRFPEDQVRVLCVGERDGKVSRTQFPALLRLIRRTRPQIVHSRNWAAIEAVLAASLIRSCAVIYSEHGPDFDTVASEPWRRTCLRRLGFELADRVLCVSNQLREFYADRTGFACRRITVIRNGVDTQLFAPDLAVRAHVRRELGIADNEFCIGCVANLTPVKDYLTVLHALTEIHHEVRHWRVIIVGKGPEESKLCDYIGAHPDLPAISFLGVSERIPEILNAFDVYVLSSLREGISNSLLEAMATGLPVCATATGGNPEIVVDGQSGLLFPVGDSGRLAAHLIRLDQEKELRLCLGQQALNRVREDFSIESMVRKYEELYRGVAS